MEDESGDEQTLGRTAEHVLGKRVAELRRARGWSQEDLARRMTDAGFPWRQTTVAKTEKADRPVRVNEADALGRLFGIKIDQLTTPDQPRLIEYLDKTRQQLVVVEAETARAMADVEQRGMQRDILKAQVKALESLIEFWRERTAATLSEALPNLLYSCGNWTELLVEAGVPPEVVEKAEQESAQPSVTAMRILDGYEAQGGGANGGEH